jgi:transcriptional regulator with XRE-family HTH domain
MDRRELADFLRKRREQLRPREVGLPERSRSRTNGLRREDVASLADISTDYYTRLEQNRGPNPSASVLQGLARALRLTDDERDHLYLLAGQAPPAHAPNDHHIAPGLLAVLDHLQDLPAFVHTPLGDLLYQTPLSQAVTGRTAGNFYLSWFLDPHGRDRAHPDDVAAHSAAHVADLRATAARRADSETDKLVTELRTGSDEFDSLWQAHTVKVRRSQRKRFVHPEVGLLDLYCEVMVSALNDQRLVVHSAAPGTDTAEKLDLLRVIGTQQLQGETL